MPNRDLRRRRPHPICTGGAIERFEYREVRQLGRYFLGRIVEGESALLNSCIAATEVTGLVIEAIRKIASAVIGRWWLTSALPKTPL